jgi:hypothetical protein
MEKRKSWLRGVRGISLVVVGIFLGATLLTPAVAHVTDSIAHLFSHTDQRYYKKVTANARFLPGATVPAGRTIRGTFTQRSGPGTYHLANYEFGGRMAGDITPHFIHVGDSPPAGCPGTAANPKANSGHLCLYATAETNISALTCAFNIEFYSCPGTDRTGFGLAIYATNAGSSFEASGRWAVKAPAAGVTAPVRKSPDADSVPGPA